MQVFTLISKYTEKEDEHFKQCTVLFNFCVHYFVDCISEIWLLLWRWLDAVDKHSPIDFMHFLNRHVIAVFESSKAVLFKCWIQKSYTQGLSSCQAVVKVLFFSLIHLTILIQQKLPLAKLKNNNKEKINNDTLQWITVHCITVLLQKYNEIQV